MTITLRDYQEQGANEIREAFAERADPVLYVLPTGGGKCLGAGTPVLMYDGSICPVESVVVGDLLMGPDSRPRRVLSLARGREPLYRVVPVKGDAYVVNESHILSLRRTGIKSKPNFPSQVGGGMVNIPVLDYLSSSATFKHEHKGWRAAVDFPANDAPLLIEPYFLGVWLGDGHSHLPTITTGDDVIAEYVALFAAKLGMRTVTRFNSANSNCISVCDQVHKGRGGSTLVNLLKRYDLFRNKHIPHPYKTGARQERLEVLAGILDTDGHYTGKGFDLTLKSERLLDDVIFVARSLGFSAYKKPSKKTCTNNGVVGDYWRCSISGAVELIPCRIARKKAAVRRQKKNVLLTGITVEPIGTGDYFGFEIDGDRLFMLGDFTVTHNTYLFSYIADSAARRGRVVYIIVHRKELLLQASASLTNLGVEHGLISPFFTPNARAKVQVASVDTLLQRLKKKQFPLDLAIFDEGHHVVATNKWGRCYELLGKPRTLAVTATPIRTDGKGLGLHAGGIFKRMVQGPTIAELIERGMLLNPRVYCSLEVPDLSDLKVEKDGEYNAAELVKRVDKPRITGSAVEQYTKHCAGERAIVFCSSIEHAKHVAEQFNASGYRFELLVGSPEMSDAERTSVNKRLRSGAIHGACTVDLVSEGYDLPDLTACIMLRPTASEALFLQQAGRVMRPSPGKNMCFLLDHVGNVGAAIDSGFKFKHGLPSKVRDWTLDGRTKKKGKAKEPEVTIDVTQCPKCYLAHAAAPTCPGCGHVYAVKARGLEVVDGELKEITADMEAQAKAEQRKMQGTARTAQEMVEKLGYSVGRATAIEKAREEKDLLRESLIADFKSWHEKTGYSSIRLFDVAISDLKWMKPKALKELRARLDAHRREKLGLGPDDDIDLAGFINDTLQGEIV